MIPKDFITAWRLRAPWAIDAQVEQDLVITRALIEIFNAPEIARSLLFRGGTALYKLYLTPPARYSEDIDLVQAEPEPIGDTLDRMRSALDPWLGEPRRQLKEGSVVLLYRFNSEDAPPLRMRLKVEINTREHFSIMGKQTMPLLMKSDWFSGQAEISTFSLDELLGTKIRALYQRRKGRDLFDLWHALGSGLGTPTEMIASFQRYLAEEGQVVTRAQFEQNLAAKRESRDFREDVEPFLRPDIAWDFDTAIETVSERLIALIPGEPWKGSTA